MAVLSGFFNSLEGDRKYDLEDFHRFFHGVYRHTGILASMGGTLKTIPGEGMEVIVKSGRAEEKFENWQTYAWYYNTEDLPLTISPAHATLDRIDLVCMDWNWDTREHSMLIVEGTPAADPVQPTMINTATRTQRLFAKIYIPAAITQIEPIHIENSLGVYNVTGFIIGLLQEIPSGTIMGSWPGRFEDLMTYWDAAITEMYNTGDLAELNEIGQKQQVRNAIVNGDFQVTQRALGATELPHSDAVTNPYSICDRWQFIVREPSVGEWVSRVYSNPATTTKGLMVQPTVAGNANDYDSITAIQHWIENSRLTELKKGTTDAEYMVLSFTIMTTQAGNYVVDLTHFVDGVPTYMISYPYYHPGFNEVVRYEWVIPPHSQGQLGDPNEADIRLSFILNAGWNYRSFGSIPNTAAWAPYFKNKRASGITNTVGSATYKSFTLHDVQLEIGKRASKYANVPYEKQLEACRRYYEAYQSYVIPANSENLTINTRGLLDFGVKKRATPVISVSTARALKYPIDPTSKELSPSTPFQINPVPSGGFQTVDEKEQAILAFDSIEIFGKLEPYKYPWVALSNLEIDSDYQAE